MSALDELPDGVQLSHVRLRSRVGPTLPLASTTPLIPRAPRPAMGQALALAETALARGDALDAVAQFRTLRARATSDAAPYLELQLSRAYVVLGNLDEAETILRERIELNTSAAWPAVYELAALRVEERGADAYETWMDLAPHCDPLRVDLARYLLGFAPTSSELSYVAVATTVPGPVSVIDACQATLTAFEARSPHDLPSWDVCPVLAPLAPAADPNETMQRRRISWQVRNWYSVARRANPADPERWLRVAQEQAETVELAPTTPAAKIASWLALVAYQNAASIAAQSGGWYDITPEYARFAYANIAKLHLDLRAPVLRLADSFLRVKR